MPKFHRRGHWFEVLWHGPGQEGMAWKEFDDRAEAKGFAKAIHLLEPRWVVNVYRVKQSRTGQRRSVKILELAPKEE